MSVKVAIVAAAARRELRTHGIRGERARPQALDTPANRATFPAEVMTRAVAPQAIAAVIASWSAAPRPSQLSDTAYVAYVETLNDVARFSRTVSVTPGS
jgi:hypothetical protein